MNKVIHRSWGEGSATIFVDLWVHVSLFSSNFAYVVIGDEDLKTICRNLCV